MQTETFAHAKQFASAGRYRDAAVALDELLSANPDDVEAHELAATIYDLFGHSHMSLGHRQHILRLRPNDAEATARLGVALWDSGDLQGALGYFRTVLSNGSATDDLHSFYLSSLLHDENQTRASLRREHENWTGFAAAPEPQPHLSADPDPSRRLRVGYVSGEFQYSPSFYFLAPFWEHRNRSEFEAIVYQLNDNDDAATSVYRDATDIWRDCRGLTDEDIVDRIARDRIDILVDLSGHFPRHALRFFGRRLAPVQITFPNYPSTTGSAHFDAMITDRWACPPGLEDGYSEPVQRLASGYLAYRPPIMPALSPSPFARNGYISFGLFQRAVKIGSRSWDAIARVLLAVPGSKLLIHNLSKELDVPGSSMRRLYIKELTSRGVEVGCILFAGVAEFDEHLQIVAEADIALDTFPYNGQTTTCECLWMGVPVVTLTGDSHVSRVAYSILARAGREEWCADSVDGYVEIAAKLAAGKDALARERAQLREQVSQSSVADGPQITRELEEVYRRLWAAHCAERKQPNL